jgi:hypothetical protein
MSSRGVVAARPAELQRVLKGRPENAARRLKIDPFGQSCEAIFGETGTESRRTTEHIGTPVDGIAPGVVTSVHP